MITAKDFRLVDLLNQEPGESPANCPFCDSTSFNGVDEHAFATQDFTSPDDYDIYDSEIGSYDWVTCNDCNNLVYFSSGSFRPDEEIDRILGLLPVVPSWLLHTLADMRLSRLLNIVYGTAIPVTAFNQKDTT